MSIIKLEPAFKDYIWGGNKLVVDFNKGTDLNRVAESWEVSSHPDGPSRVASGELKGKTLNEYIDVKGRGILGERGKAFDFFPILIKFIDAKRDLSIQVHPSDAYALEHEGQYGKTEMWYVLEAEPDSYVYYGTKKKITSDDYRRAIENNTILEILNKVPVKKGDVIFVEAGTIHAIGAGIVICEIQQNSNVTYRVYDFNRKDVHGNTRELHINKAVEVSNLTPLDASFKPSGETINLDQHTETLLANHPLFRTELINLDGAMSMNVDKQSFAALICIEGSMSIMYDNETEIKLAKGESVFIEANTFNIHILGSSAFLKVCV